MAVLEAAAAGLPVMLTPQCNFPELAEAGGAVEVSPDVSGCETGLRQLLALPDSDVRLWAAWQGFGRPFLYLGRWSQTRCWRFITG